MSPLGFSLAGSNPAPVNGLSASRRTLEGGGRIQGATKGLNATQRNERMAVRHLPWVIRRLKERGGPTDDERIQAVIFGVVPAEERDILKFFALGLTERRLSDLVETVAVLTFVEGRVLVFGKHF